MTKDIILNISVSLHPRATVHVFTAGFPYRASLPKSREVPFSCTVVFALEATECERQHRRPDVLHHTQLNKQRLQGTPCSTGDKAPDTHPPIVKMFVRRLAKHCFACGSFRHCPETVAPVLIALRPFSGPLPEIYRFGHHIDCLRKEAMS